MIFLLLFRQFFIASIFLMTYTSCEDKEVNSNDPAAAFADAREYYDDENYDIALQKLGEFKSRFPYSKYAALAELFIANSNFELGNYEIAAVDYKQFIKLHPKHQKAPFAMFRVGESYWIDAPENIDRDQDLTVKAIEEWQTLISTYPDSQYTKRALAKIELGERRIAESQQFVADFYCKMEIYHACAYRFISILEAHSKYSDIKRHALVQAGEALILLAELKKDKPDSDKNIFFKKMSWQDIEAKGKGFLKLAQKMPDD